MLDVTFVYDPRGFPHSVEADGHADWAELGKDVVCAAVSTILQSTWLGIAEITAIPIEGIRESGKLAMRWPESACDNPALGTLIATADLSICQLSAQYPRHINHMRRGPAPAWKKRDEGA